MKNGKSNLILFNGTVNAVSYIDNAINDGMLPVFNAIQNILLMHDNAPTNIALITRDHLQNLGIPVLSWPSRSPDLNPIDASGTSWSGGCKQGITGPTTLPSSGKPSSRN